MHEKNTTNKAKKTNVKLKKFITYRRQKAYFFDVVRIHTKNTIENG